MLLSLSVLACSSHRHCCNHARETHAPTPRVRLVRDTPDSYHFQWAEPLTEARIILVRVQWQSDQYPDHDETRLIFFEPGQFKSARYSLAYYQKSATVEILPARDRNSFSLPAMAAMSHSRSDYILPPHTSSDKEILAEHPFEPYEFDAPSKLVISGVKNQ